MNFKFEKLIIWQLAMEYGENMNNLIKLFPKEETYNLSSQLRRACDSIALNIAEGSICQSNRELGKFAGYSIRSLAEVVTCLYKAKNRSYIDSATFDRFYQEGFTLMNMLVAYRKKVLGGESDFAKKTEARI